MRTQVIRKCLSLCLTTVCATVVCQTAVGQSGPDSSGLSSSLSSNSIASGTSGRTSTGTSGTSGSTSQTSGLTTGPTSTAGTPAQTFIGANATQAFVGGAREATNQQSMNRQFQAFQAAQTQANTQSQQTGTPREVRTVLRIGFNFPTASSALQSGTLASANALSLSRFSQNRPELAGVNVRLTGDGTAVLTGSLPTTDSSRLAANLMRIQPGVRKVDNQIAVTP